VPLPRAALFAALVLSSLSPSCKDKAPEPDPPLPAIELRGAHKRDPNQEKAQKALTPLALDAKAGEGIGSAVAIGTDFVVTAGKGGSRLVVTPRANGNAAFVDLDAPCDALAADAAIAAGLPTSDGGRGAVRIVERDPNGWAFGARLVPADPRAAERFGQGLALAGGLLAVAAERRVLIFERKKGGFALAFTLPEKDDLPEKVVFEEAVAIAGGAVIARAAVPGGTPTIHLATPDGKGGWKASVVATKLKGSRAGFAATEGLVALHVREGRAGEAAVELLDLAKGDSVRSFAGGRFFGEALALGPSLVVIGERTATGGRGRVFVHERKQNDWQLAALLVADEPKPDDGFGAAIALRDRTIAVGAPGRAARAGALYVWTAP
jgi:hypothetical protein